jgi:D-serine deaminase-like pyridoxal phosphate-dependent protein
MGLRGVAATGRDREPAADRYARYRAAIAGEALPLAIVDLDAFERNVDAVVLEVEAGARATIRVATKSLRCLDLLRRVAARGRGLVRGALCVSAREAAFLASNGVDDVLVAYPSAQPSDAAIVAASNAAGRRVAVTVDAREHVDVLARAATAASTRVPVVIDVDVSLRALGDRVHLGARRSPIAAPDEAVAIARAIAEHASLELAGVLAYEAQVAGVPDVDAGRPSVTPLRRAAVTEGLARAGFALALVNGGGSGSLAWSARDASVTEVAVGSAFVQSHLFDGFRDLDGGDPAIAFALQAARRPAHGFVTCLGGGFVASGAAGLDRLPKPWLPAGLALTPLEGAGEVQTPLTVPPGVEIAIGDPIFFRPAKAGELAEHVSTYLLVRGDRVEARAPTYRGEGLHIF